jgi:dTDP-4-amino-4,6-dideoxygalactose transaminase
MSELQGAVMHAQIKKLPFILATCRTYYKRIVDSLEACDLYKVRPVPEGSCGITLFLKFKSLYDANRFSKALSDEGIPIGPSSGCENIANSYLILSKNMPFNKMPPYWQERQKDNAIFDGSPLCPDTDEIISRYVGIGIGPTYGEQEIDDIINAINKVSRYLR